MRRKLYINVNTMGQAAAAHWCLLADLCSVFCSVDARVTNTDTCCTPTKARDCIDLGGGVGSIVNTRTSPRKSTNQRVRFSVERDKLSILLLTERSAVEHARGILLKRCMPSAPFCYSFNLRRTLTLRSTAPICN
jgi:hypothetical protein